MLSADPKDPTQRVFLGMQPFRAVFNLTEEQAKKIALDDCRHELGKQNARFGVHAWQELETEQTIERAIEGLTIWGCDPETGEPLGSPDDYAVRTVILIRITEQTTYVKTVDDDHA